MNVSDAMQRDRDRAREEMERVSILYGRHTPLDKRRRTAKAAALRRINDVFGQCQKLDIMPPPSPFRWSWHYPAVYRDQRHKRR